MGNMDIYNAVRAVPKEAQKEFHNGSFSGTDINPMWRIKTLTEQFGPCGTGWWTQDVTYWIDRTDEGEVYVNCSLNLYVGKDSRPVHGIGANRMAQNTKNGKRFTDEAYKMAYTDALSVACKALGIGADIYFGQDRTKYTQPTEEPPAPPKPAPTRAQTIAAAAKAAGIDTKLVAAKILEYGVEKANDLTQKQFDELMQNMKEGAFPC